MDDLRSLRATCRFLRGVTSDRAVGQCIDVHWFAAAMLWNDHAAYAALLAHLTDIGNPVACYITGMNNAFSKGTPEARPSIIELACAAKCGHNVAAYVDAILLFRANTGAETTKLRGGTCAKSRVKKQRRGRRAAPADQCSATREHTGVDGYKCSSRWRRCRVATFPAQASRVAVLSMSGTLMD